MGARKYNTLEKKERFSVVYNFFEKEKNYPSVSLFFSFVLGYETMSIITVIDTSSLQNLVNTIKKLRKEPGMFSFDRT